MILLLRGGGSLPGEGPGEGGWTGVVAGVSQRGPGVGTVPVGVVDGLWMIGGVRVDGGLTREEGLAAIRAIRGSENGAIRAILASVGTIRVRLNACG